MNKKYERFNRLTLSMVVLAVLFAFTGLIIATQLTDKNEASADKNICKGVCVALKADGAEPDIVTVKVGETVQFNSADGNSHNLSNGLGGEEHEHSGPYSSGEFKSDEAWRVQFKQPGTFKFHDHLNPNINVLVVAYNQGS